MATTKAQINKFHSGTNRKSKYTKFFKRSMNKLFRQAYKQRDIELFKHHFSGY